MSFCAKCGAYIPMEDTACPACGFDPEAEAREAARRAAEEEARRAAEEKRRAEEAQKAAEEEARRAREAAQRAEQQRREEQHRRTTGAQYASQRASYSAPKSHYTSQRTGSYQTRSESGTKQEDWVAPWTEGSTGSRGYDPEVDRARAKAKDSADHQRLSLLSYLGPLFLVPLLLRKDDEFARFHANQGLLLFLFTAATRTLGVIPLLGGLLQAVGTLGTLYGIYKGLMSVLKGRKDRLPVIGGIDIIK